MNSFTRSILVLPVLLGAGCGEAEVAEEAPIGRAQLPVTPAGDIGLLGDLDGDGKSEIVVWTPSTGTWSALRTDDFSNGFPGGGNLVYGNPGDIPFLADLDGDGADDAVLFRPLTATWYGKRADGSRVLPKNGRAFGAQGDVPLVGNLDSDPAQEIIVWRPSTATWRALNADGTPVTLAGGQELVWGYSDDIPLTGDVDGNPGDELVTWRPSTGAWLAKRPNGSRVFTQGSEPTLGRPGDIPFLGDLDAKGSDELIVWRTRYGKWYAETVAGVSIFTPGEEPVLGNVNDVPLVGDVAPGSDDELVVWGPSWARWSATDRLKRNLFENVSLGTPPTKLSFMSIESDTRLLNTRYAQGPVLFARTTTADGGEDGWLLRFDFTIRNNLTTSLGVGAYFATVKGGSAEVTNATAGATIAAGQSARIRWPNELTGEGAMPTSLTLEARVGLGPERIATTIDLREYVSSTPSGGYRFPGNNDDLNTPDGHVYWYAGLHANALDQRYGYDLGNRRWTDPGWTSIKDGGDKDTKEDYLIWNRRVIAISDGTIVRCNRSVDDHDVRDDDGLPVGDQTGGAGGNSLVVDLGDGTFLKYSHFKRNTITRELCPTEAGTSDDLTPTPVRILEGDELGNVGMSGNTTSPHLHIVLMDNDNPEDSITRGLPLRFSGLSFLPETGGEWDIWSYVASGQSIMPLRAIIDPWW